MVSSSSRTRKLLRILSAAAALAAFLAAAAAALPVPAEAAEAEAHHEEHHCGSLARLTRECRSFLFGGEAAPSPACCEAYAAAYAANKPLCLCYLDDATFWRAKGYDAANATGDSFRIPDICGQAEPWPIAFWCEEHGLPPYGQAQGKPAKHPPAAAAPTTTTQPPASAAIPTTAAQHQPPSGSSAATTPPPQPPPATSKAKGHSSPELISLLLVAVAAVCSISISI